jgi:CDP-diacylglycerol--serine O-phosphatidyltransferase
LPRWGWLFALAHALCCALRLARFNAQIDTMEKPHKSAGFLTGVPAPAGAGVLFLPMFLWLATGLPVFTELWLVVPWTALAAFLMASSLPTYGWSSLRLRRGVRFGALAGIALLGAALITAPWETLSVVTIAYVAAIPFAIRSYARVRRLRDAAKA